jgi:hypothetical protein
MNKNVRILILESGEFLEERRQLALVGLDGGGLEVWDGGDGVASVIHGLVSCMLEIAEPNRWGRERGLEVG